MENKNAYYRNYVLAMLTLVYVFNFIDRQLLVILQEAIKKELDLSDTQLGLMSGFTFALFYATLGIPIARLADKSNRRTIVAVSLGLWSLMTALSGLSRNFVQLLLARIGVGVGEAGGSPPAHAIISDYFPVEKRSTALSIYSMGIYFGILIGFIMGGYLNQYWGWRASFYLLGIPGIVFSLLFYFTVKEPIRDTDSVQNELTFAEGIKKLYSTKTFTYLSFAAGFHAFCIYGMFNWEPSYLTRVHGLSSAQTGTYLGLIYGITGVVGTYSGGYLTDKFGKTNKRWYLLIPLLAIVLSIPFFIGNLSLRNTTYVFVCLGFVNFFYSIYLGPAIAVTHSLVPASLRAFSSAVLFLVINLLGMGCGPLAVGFLSDKLSVNMGVNALPWAMGIVIPVSLLSGTLFLLASKHLVSDLEKVKS